MNLSNFDFACCFGRSMYYLWWITIADLKFHGLTHSAFFLCLCYVQCKYSWLVIHMVIQNPGSFHFMAPLVSRASDSSAKDCTSVQQAGQESGGLCKGYLWAGFGKEVHHFSLFFHWPELKHMAKSYYLGAGNVVYMSSRSKGNGF